MDSSHDWQQKIKRLAPSTVSRGNLEDEVPALENRAAQAYTAHSEICAHVMIEVSL